MQGIVIMGSNNRFEGQSSVGSPAEHHEYFVPDDAERVVLIGNGNVIREFTTINAPTTGVTSMGNNCIMLRHSHLSHDSALEDRVTVSCNVLIGGHTHVMQGANLGLGSIIHQHHLIGAYAMLGMGTVVPRRTEIKCARTYVGNPARFLKLNTVGVERASVSQDAMAIHVARYLKLQAERV
jgi:UDP-N-acetylglucosamine acyltransferase